jgi:hypothetical protein
LTFGLFDPARRTKQADGGSQSLDCVGDADPWKFNMYEMIVRRRHFPFADSGQPLFTPIVAGVGRAQDVPDSGDLAPIEMPQPLSIVTSGR